MITVTCDFCGEALSAHRYSASVVEQYGGDNLVSRDDILRTAGRAVHICDGCESFSKSDDWQQIIADEIAKRFEGRE